eukprot:scaffold64182_cov33-Tisochrysis_lutea.AAC.3
MDGPGLGACFGFRAGILELGLSYTLLLSGASRGCRGLVCALCGPWLSLGLAPGAGRGAT